MQLLYLPWLLTIIGQITTTSEAWIPAVTCRPHRRPLLFPVRVSINDRSSPSSIKASALSSNNAHLEVVQVPDFVTSPVLRQVYPHMLAYQKLHGHVNIPLGSSAGRQCQTLRRLQLQQKLTDSEVEFLTQLQFRFTTLDDIYFQVPFDEMFQRLLEYEQQYPGTGYQIPKKYPPDPELGAWVTGLRRLAPKLIKDDDDVDDNESANPSSATGSSSGRIHPDHVDRLNTIGFSWKSERKCGSRFMKFYRDLLQRIRDETEHIINDDESQKANARLGVLQDPSVQAWIAAQRDTFHRGSMSETRQHYMTTLVGDESWKVKPDP